MSAVPAKPVAPSTSEASLPVEAAGAPADAGARSFNRDLSWLEFNRRVLRLATDERTPLLVRVKFLAIFSSNLDEFFMKRVGLLKRLVATRGLLRSSAGLSPAEQLEAVRRTVVELQTEQAQCYEQVVLPALAQEGIELVDYGALSAPERERVDRWHHESVFPILTPLAVDPGHRFPFISNLSESLGVMLAHPDRDERLFARVKIPELRPRWVRVDEPGAPLSAPRTGQSLRVVNLEGVIRNNLDDLFPGMTIQSVMPFRVTRDAEVTADEDADDLLETVEAAMKQRRFAAPVRLEVGPKAPRRLLDFVLEELELGPQDVYQRSGLLEYGDLFDIASLEIPRLRFAPWTPIAPPRLADEDTDIFTEIRKGDILVHHPYDSFAESVERFIKAASRDPKVVAIKQTIYRTSADSPFITSMIRAAESGKQTACLVELRARFEEMANVTRAQTLEKAGVHVAYGVVGLKTHAKIALVVRREPDAPGGLRCYGHIGTGNYNSQTAMLYTDLGLLTCDPRITSDIVELFNYLTGRSRKRDYQRLLVAPVAMRQQFVEMVDREIAIARSGQPGRIIAKMNALEDEGMVEKLYEASNAGVQIDLMVRGFCCLRPGVAGMSENIRVRSTIGRFLEHSRVYYFGAGQPDPLDGDWFIGSSDWMHRNLDFRVEAITPIRDRNARRKLKGIIDVLLADQRDAWALNPDGTYTQLAPPADADPESPEALGAFEKFMRQTLAEQRAALMEG
ncbi:MAG: polyphosphate kinase 1 [Phycisphaerales bacterium]|nr:polyphosphate kinase 1 [Phycisphaerales bacterium]